jgi:predicted dehydrogenase
MADTLRFALLGAGFWARYQLAAWAEQEDVQCIAVCDPDRAKAEWLAKEFDIPLVHTSPETLFNEAVVDFADVVTPPHTHTALVRLCAGRGVPVICQKPMAETLADAEGMVSTCAQAGVPFLIHENWRWQTPLREFGNLLHEGAIGKVFRGRITFSCSFPVFDNQPFLADAEQFILSDIGSHILDVARFLFGEAAAVYCQTRRINPKIKGEDVATVMMAMGPDAGTTVVCEMSYATRSEHERFPQTYVFAEGEDGSLELGPDYLVRLTDPGGTYLTPTTTIRRVPPPRYAWADPAYDLVQASMVPCQADLLKHLRGLGVSENLADSNLETVRLIFASYESAAKGLIVIPSKT